MDLAGPCVRAANSGREDTDLRFYFVCGMRQQWRPSAMVHRVSS
jgi:hypothetical protein